MVAEPVLVLFCGGMGGSPIEEVLAAALRECALDTIEEALATGAYGGALLVADEAAAAATDGRLPAGTRLDLDTGGPFHFGDRLKDVVRRYELERPVYAGCGMPFLKADELAAIAQLLSSTEGVV